MDKNKKEKPECHDLEDFIAACETDRLSRLEEILEQQEEYMAFSQREKELFESLKRQLPREMLPPLLEYSDVAWNRRAAEIRYFYKQGLLDGACLLDMLKGGRKQVKLDIRVV